MTLAMLYLQHLRIKLGNFIACSKIFASNNIVKVVRDGTRRLLLLHESVHEKTNQGWKDKSVMRVTLVSRGSLVYPYVTHMIDFFFVCLNQCWEIACIYEKSPCRWC